MLKKIIVGAVVINVIVWGLFSYKGINQQKLEAKKDKVVQQNIQLVEKLEVQKKEKAIENPRDSKNIDARKEYIKEYTEKIQDVSKRNTSIFMEYFNWKNSEEFEKRKDKLQGMISEKVLNNPTVFSSSIDNTGGDYIATLELQSKYISDDTYLEIGDDEGEKQISYVDATYESWYGSTKRSEKKDGVYKLIYDVENKNISEMILLYK